MILLAAAGFPGAQVFKPVSGFGAPQDFASGVRACLGMTGDWEAWKHERHSQGWTDRGETAAPADPLLGEGQTARFERGNIAVHGTSMRARTAEGLGPTEKRCNVLMVARSDEDADAALASARRLIEAEGGLDAEGRLPGGTWVMVHPGFKTEYGTVIGTSLYVDPR